MGNKRYILLFFAVKQTLYNYDFNLFRGACANLFIIIIIISVICVVVYLFLFVVTLPFS